MMICVVRKILFFLLGERVVAGRVSAFAGTAELLMKDHPDEKQLLF